MDTITAIHSRRSIRAFTAQAVERGLIESVIADAAQAPPAFRGQVNWTFGVVQGVERIAALAERVMAHARAEELADPQPRWLLTPGAQVFWGAPVLIVMSGMREDCCRAGQNMMLSAHARGLGTCWVGSPMPWLRSDEGRAELRIPAGQDPVVAMCLGYPASIPAAPDRAPPPVLWVT